MFGIFDLISYSYSQSSRNSKNFRKTDGVHGQVRFGNSLVGYESGLEKIFAIMMAVDPQVISIFHQPMTFKYHVTTVERQLTYTPDYRVVRDNSKVWIWGDSLKDIPGDCLFEVKPIERLAKVSTTTRGAQGALIAKIQESGEFGFKFFTNQTIPRYQVENILRVGAANPSARGLKAGVDCLTGLKAGSRIALLELAAELSAIGHPPIPVLLGLMRDRQIAGMYHHKEFLIGEAVVIGG